MNSGPDHDAALAQPVLEFRDRDLAGVEHGRGQRAIDVVRRDYAGINLEIRTERPDDFILYSEVEIGGADPNGLGLLGYDNVSSYAPSMNGWLDAGESVTTAVPAAQT